MKGSRADHAEAEKQRISPTVAEVAEFVKLILLETDTDTEQCGFVFANSPVFLLHDVKKILSRHFTFSSKSLLYDKLFPFTYHPD